MGTTLTVSGDTTLVGELDVSGDTTLKVLTTSAAAIMGTTLNVSGDTTLVGELDVSGDTTLENSLDVCGTTTMVSLTATGATVLTSTLGVSGNTSLDGTLDVSGNTTLENSLDVCGATTMSTLTATGQIQAGSFYTTGEISGDTIVANTLNGEDLSYLSGLTENIQTAINSNTSDIADDCVRKTGGAQTMTTSLTLSGGSLSTLSSTQHTRIQPGTQLIIYNSDYLDTTTNGSIGGESVNNQVMLGARLVISQGVLGTNYYIGYIGGPPSAINPSFAYTMKQDTGLKIDPAYGTDDFTDALHVVGTGNFTSNLTVGGTVTATGQITAASFNATSDYRIKENILDLSSVHIIDNLRPVTYTNTSLNKQCMGFIAHEVQNEYPFLVNGVKDGPSNQNLDYNGIIPLLVKEVKELKEQVKLLMLSQHNNK